MSLQYAYACDAVDTKRFKIRLSERNYTFTAETESSRNEWVKAIQKVMFRTQHEGECVKVGRQFWSPNSQTQLIMPLEAIVEVDKSPTLEFAETIEIKCVDPEDQMSMDSYFFASFADTDRAYDAIQSVLAARSSSELPRVSSNLSQEMQAASAESSSAPQQRQSSVIASTAAPLVRKLGSVLKPLKPFVSRDADKGREKSDATPEGKSSSGLSIPFLSKAKPSHDSLETLRHDQDLEEAFDGYPPRQTGPIPSSFDEKTWKSTWMRKPPQDSKPTPPGWNSSRDRNGRRVTEVVESVFPGSEDESDREFPARKKTAASMSFSSRSDFSVMEQSEGGREEDEEVARKFRSVFSLSEKEELIDRTCVSCTGVDGADFPGYLYRVLPVSGRFFVSTNYFCFRSSQLLYKTKVNPRVADPCRPKKSADERR